MKNKKRFPIKLIIIGIFLILCVAILFIEFYQSKKAEQTLAQLQTEQEERRKQEQLERQAQKEQAKQKQEELNKIKESLPVKFDMRDKLKISVEHQGQKPFCVYYAEIKAREIALNYQGNYNYNFKEAYKYLKTAPDEIKDNYDTDTLLKDLIGLDNNYNINWSLGDLELKNSIVTGKPLLMMIDKRLSSKIRGDSNWSDVKSGYQGGSGHELVVIGYDDEKQSWLCLNSWGTSWKNNGTGWIEYNDEGIMCIGGLEEISK